MSLLPTSAVVPSSPTSHTASPAARSDDQKPDDAGTFGEALQRSRTAVEETARETRDKKLTGRSELRHPTGKEQDESGSAATLAAPYIVLDTLVVKKPTDMPRPDVMSGISGANDADRIAHDVPRGVGIPGGPKKGEAAQVPETDALQASAAEHVHTGLGARDEADIVWSEPGRDRPGKPALHAAGASAAKTGAVAREAGVGNTLAAGSNTNAVNRQPMHDAAPRIGPEDATSTPEKSGLPRANTPTAADFVDPATAPAREASPSQPLQSDASAARETGTALPPPHVNVPNPPAVIDTAAGTPTPVLQLTSEVGSREWADALGKQMTWMGNARHQVAELRLNPPDLGSLNVTLTLTDNQAQAIFVSAHPAVRAAVEAALPQLRATLADSGISLGNTSVSADTQQQQGAYTADQAAYRTDRGAGLAVGEAASAIEPPVTLSALGNGSAVDTFA